MKKKKVMLKEREISSSVIYCSDRIRVSKEKNNELFFEIENEITSDLSEAIAIAINKNVKEEEFWNMMHNINISNVSPDKALYWLSGGDEEWISRNNYKRSWADSYLLFQAEFGLTVINIIEKSKTFGEIKSGFYKKINMETLYEFSLENNLIF